jgi:nucleotide-binding universal stress UspA family protein
MKFLVAYNGSEQSTAALQLAIHIGEKYGAKLYVLTSMEGGPDEKPEEIARVKTALKTAKENLDAAGLAYEVDELARGLSPGEDLVDFADENEIDHIFVGIEKRSKTRKLLLGSTAQYIILHAPCPVTTVK